MVCIVVHHYVVLIDYIASDAIPFKVTFICGKPIKKHIFVTPCSLIAQIFVNVMEGTDIARA